MRWHDGSVAPSGYRYLERFWLDGTVPVWRFATGRFVLEKRIIMDQGANVTRIDYANLWSREPVALSVRVIADHRDYHGRTFAWDGIPAPIADGDTLSIPAGGTADLHVRLEDGRAEASGTWYRGFDLAQERARGLTDSEDHVFAGTLSATLAPGQHGAARRQLRGAPCGDRRRRARRPAVRREQIPARRLARGARRRRRRRRPPGSRQLVLAADQFIVGRRTCATAADGHTRDRRLSLVRGLGPRHDDQPARPDARRPAGRRSPRSILRDLRRTWSTAA